MKRPVHVAYVEQDTEAPPNCEPHFFAMCSVSMEGAGACPDYDGPFWDKYREPRRAIDRAVARLDKNCPAHHVHPRSQS